MVSNAAIIAGIKIYKRFPDVMKNWFPLILNQLRQEKKPHSYHGLVLLSMNNEF